MTLIEFMSIFPIGLVGNVVKKVSFKGNIHEIFSSSRLCWENKFSNADYAIEGSKLVSKNNLINKIENSNYIRYL